MNIKLLQKAGALHNEILEFDKEIIEIEKWAKELSENETEVTLSASYPKEEKSGVQTIEERYLQGGIGSVFIAKSEGWFGEMSNKEIKNAQHQWVFNSTEMLFILNAIHRMKMEQRSVRIKALKGLGINI